MPHPPGSRRHLAAVLLSRQPLRPNRNTPWVKESLKAVRWIKDQRLSLLTSTGMQTWELLVTLARREQIPQIIVVPALTRDQSRHDQARLMHQFDLDPGLVGFASVLPRDQSGKRAELMRLRDKAILSRAHVLIPVCIRNKGGMSAHVRRAQGAGKTVVPDFAVEYEPRATHLHYSLDQHEPTPTLMRQGKSHITHWTRASNTAWPTERQKDYYEAILSWDTYPRNAFASLCNILDKQKIVASSRHMPGNVHTVSFSGARPRHMASLFRWRTKYREMSFEPYGIGVEREFALQHGIRPVTYHNASVPPPIENEAWLLQSQGRITDWQKEDEFRYLGDFGLEKVPREKLVCFCHTGQEAAYISKRYGIRTVPFAT